MKRLTEMDAQMDGQPKKNIGNKAHKSEVNEMQSITVLWLVLIVPTHGGMARLS